MFHQLIVTEGTWRCMVDADTKTAHCQPFFFHIYTTGLGNWQDFTSEKEEKSPVQHNDQNLIKIWNQDVREHIFSLVPDQFKIKLYHYDPLTYSNDQASLKKYVKTNLIVTEKAISRVDSSEFIAKNLDITNLQEPYIILDIAALFRYEPSKIHTVQYHKLENGKWLLGKELTLNSVRFGFMGDINPRLLAKTKLFEVTQDGQVLTYIDKMIQINAQQQVYKFDPHSPSHLILDKMLPSMWKTNETDEANIKQIVDTIWSS